MSTAILPISRGPRKAAPAEPQLSEFGEFMQELGDAHLAVEEALLDARGLYQSGLFRGDRNVAAIIVRLENSLIALHLALNLARAM